LNSKCCVDAHNNEDAGKPPCGMVAPATLQRCGTVPCWHNCLEERALMHAAHHAAVAKKVPEKARIDGEVHDLKQTTDSTRAPKMLKSKLLCGRNSRHRNDKSYKG
jgi:hypothetical protein